MSSNKPSITAIAIFATVLSLSVSTYAGWVPVKAALDVGLGDANYSSLPGWDMAYADRALWRYPSSTSVASGDTTITFSGTGGTSSGYTRDYIADDYGSQGAVTETRKFIEDGFFNSSSNVYTTISGLIPDDPVQMWCYAWGGGNASGTTRYYFDLDNDGSWDTDLLGSGDDYVDVSTTRSIVPNVIAPQLLTGTGFAVGTSQTGTIDYGIMQINFIPQSDTIRVQHIKVGGNGWLNGALIYQVPEPASMALLLLGGGLLATRRARCRR